jgi:hypothetical protein
MATRQFPLRHVADLLGGKVVPDLQVHIFGPGNLTNHGLVTQHRACVRWILNGHPTLDKMGDLLFPGMFISRTAYERRLSELERINGPTVWIGSMPQKH